jgi:hypothetical protein
MVDEIRDENGALQGYQTGNTFRLLSASNWNWLGRARNARLAGQTSPRLRFQCTAWLHGFKRLCMRYERTAFMHEAFLSLACRLICYRHL